MHTQIVVLVNVGDEIVCMESEEGRVGYTWKLASGLIAIRCLILAENGTFMFTHHQFQKHKKMKSL